MKPKPKNKKKPLKKKELVIIDANTQVWNASIFTYSEVEMFKKWIEELKPQQHTACSPHAARMHTQPLSLKGDKTERITNLHYFNDVKGVLVIIK